MNHSSDPLVRSLGNVRRAHLLPGANSTVHRALRGFGRAAASAIALILALPILVAAQGNATRPRVTDRVDVAQLATLKGNTHRLARPQFDQGAAPANLPMSRMMLLLQPSPEQEAALQDLLEQQQVSSSPNFRKWLTPEQFGQQFGPADADIQAVTSWLASFGFQNIRVSRGRTMIEFSGTASQVETALHTPIHRYLVNGESHWANVSDPQIPAALAPVIAGFVSLHDFRYHPAIRKSDRKLPFTVKNGERPQINFSGGSHGLVPGDFNKIYNVGSTMTGAGVTIAIVANSNINVQDVIDFRNMFGLGSPSNLPNIVLNGPDPGVVTTGSEGEAVLDATWAGAVAPAATVDLVVSEDTNAAQGTDLSEAYIVDNNLADVMTESFSTCEALSGSFALTYGLLARQAAAQGITYLVSSGDGGPDSCDDPGVAPATTAASVNLLAATPFNVAVGGTMFNEGASPSTYWSNSNNPTTGESALSYIPENVWNESCTTLSSTCPVVGLWSSGGGASSAFNKPTWQVGIPGIPAATNARFLPDVSLNAADHDGYVICIEGSCQGTGCPTPGTICFGIASGTSASVQAFGGIIALVDQAMGGRVGNANYTLYKLAGLEMYSNCNGSTGLLANTCVFNDVTVGHTNIPGETGFTAGVEYDQATGLGSVNVTNLVNNWNTPGKASVTTALKLNGVTTPLSATHGNNVPVAITVFPVAPGTTPTGEVSLIASGDSSCNFNLPGDFAASLNSGTASFTTSCLPGGSYPVHAHYDGDANYLPNDSNTINVTITKEGSQIHVGLLSVSGNTCLSSPIAYGSPYVLGVAVADLNAISLPCIPSETGASPTGTVTLTDKFLGNTTPLDGGLFHLNSGGWFEDQTIQLAGGTHTITATYSGDSNFNVPASAGTVTVNVTPASTTTTVSANMTSIGVGQSVTLTATVASPNSNATASLSQEPTGTVQFFVDTVAFGNPVAVVGNAPGGAFAESTASVSTTALVQGSRSITAQYSGDSNYLAGNLSTILTVNVGQPGINVSSGCTSSTITISAAGQPGTCMINVSGANGFNGTVTLSAAVATSPSGAVYPPACNSFTPSNTITLNSGTPSGNATMTCSTTAKTDVFRPYSRPTGRAWPFAGAAIALGGFFFLFVIRRQRRWGLVPLTVLLAVVVMAGVSCSGNGYGGGGGGGNPGTTTGTYTITVTATPNTGTAQTATVSVVVN